jgi:hypothetical protein
MDIERQGRRNRKVARTLIRLKHSLDADDEIEQYLEAQKAALTKGVLAKADVTLKELLGS